MDWKKVLANLAWKKIAYSLYHEGIRPFLAEFVKDSSVKWDDAMLEALDEIIEKVLK